MRLRVALSLGLLIVPSIAAARPSFTVGSDPYETIFAYPHDILRWPARATYLIYSPQTMPWQGDVTRVQNRPSDSYTSNYQEVEFAPPYDYQGDPAALRSWARVGSYLHQNTYRVGGVTDTPAGRFLLEVGNVSTDMDLTAEGVARSEEEGAYQLVPFHGATRGNRDDYDVQLIHARTLFGDPLGLKVQYTDQNASRPGGYIDFTRDGTEYRVPHLTWGWATTGCNHIFGYPHINVDAFYQDRFTVFDGHQWDFQMSHEHAGNWKSGLRYRTSRQDGDNFAWSYDEGSSIEGDYYVDPHWKDRQSAHLLRGYTRARFFRSGGLDAGMLYLLEYDADALTQVNKLVEAEPNSKEGKRGVVAEANPYFNFAMPGGFVDFGLLLEAGRTGMRNSETRWNPVSAAEERDVLWSTEPNLGWTEYWERFSQGHQWFYATGAEGNASIGVYKGLSTLLRITILRKGTHTTKQYGETEIPEGGHSYEFAEKYRRQDYRNETWMTGMLGFSMRWRRATLYLTQDLPTAYLLKQSTKLSDSNEVLFDHEQRRMWQVQQPSGTRLFLVYALMP